MQKRLKRGDRERKRERERIHVKEVEQETNYVFSKDHSSLSKSTSFFLPTKYEI